MLNFLPIDPYPTRTSGEFRADVLIDALKTEENFHNEIPSKISIKQHL